MSVTLKCGSQYRVFVSQRRRRIVEARRRLVIPERDERSSLSRAVALSHNPRDGTIGGRR
jgi:hypothetical protein